jgi:hypothetical protein
MTTGTAIYAGNSRAPGRRPQAAEPEGARLSPSITISAGAAPAATAPGAFGGRKKSHWLRKITHAGLSETASGRVLDQPKVSHLLRGRLSGCSGYR